MVLYQWTHWAVAISRSSMEFQGPLVSDQFGFIQRVECLGERVVVGVALGADRGDGVAVGKGVPVTDRGVLDAPIRMVNEAC